jgi:hypothetical protein
MDILAGAVAVLVAAVALHRLHGGLGLRRGLEGLFRRALPGARTGPAKDEASEATPVSRFHWTEVVNLTAAKVATPPRRATDRPAEAESTAVDRR